MVNDQNLQSTENNFTSYKLIEILVISVLALVPFSILLATTRASLRHYLLFIIFNLIFFFLTVRYLEKQGVSFQELLKLRSITIDELVFPLIVGVTLAVIGGGISWGFQTVATLPSKVNVLLNLKAAVIMATIKAFVAAISEEYYFRYLLFTYLRSKLPQVSAVMLAALIYAILHFDYSITNMLFMLGSRFILGATLSLLYIKYKNLFPSIVTHFVYNTVLYLGGLIYAFAK